MSSILFGIFIIAPLLEALEEYMDIEEGVLKVHYDGVGLMLQKHQMKAKSVSRSIQAVETIYVEAILEANKVFKSNVSTEVFLEGGFKEGSLWWLLRVFGRESEKQFGLEQKSTFTVVSSAINKVVGILKLMKSEQAEIVIRANLTGYEVEIDGNPVHLDEVECAILTNDKIRSALSDLAMPLEDDGVDQLFIKNYNNPELSIKINSNEKDSLIINRKHKQIIDEGEILGLFSIENLSYNPKSKWKVVAYNDPNFTFSATIADAEFLKRVSDNTVKFSKDDLLDIVVNWYSEKAKFTGKITNNYTIIKVKDHVPVEDRQWKIL